MESNEPAWDPSIAPAAWYAQPTVYGKDSLVAAVWRVWKQALVADFYKRGVEHIDAAKAAGCADDVVEQMQCLMLTLALRLGATHVEPCLQKLGLPKDAIDNMVPSLEVTRQVWRLEMSNAAHKKRKIGGDQEGPRLPAREMSAVMHHLCTSIHSAPPGTAIEPMIGFNLDDIDTETLKHLLPTIATQLVQLLRYDVLDAFVKWFGARVLGTTVKSVCAHIDVAWLWRDENIHIVGFIAHNQLVPFSIAMLPPQWVPRLEQPWQWRHLPSICQWSGRTADIQKCICRAKMALQLTDRAVVGIMERFVQANVNIDQMLNQGTAILGCPVCLENWMEDSDKQWTVPYTCGHTICVPCLRNLVYADCPLCHRTQPTHMNQLFAR